MNFTVKELIQKLNWMIQEGKITEKTNVAIYYPCMDGAMMDDNLEDIKVKNGEVALIPTALQNI